MLQPVDTSGMNDLALINCVKMCIIPIISIFKILGVGRANLILITRLVLKGLLEFSMQSKCRMLHCENQQLRDFFIVAEKVLRHGFKGKGSMI